MVSFDIQGIVAPVFTPTKDNGDINLSLVPEYMQHLVSNGVGSILVGGTTGEYETLSLEERKLVLEAWLEAARSHGTKVIAQVGGVPLPDVLHMARFAQLKRADAIMTLPELYYKPKTVDQLVSFLELVSKAAPSLPLLYYHFPMMSGVDVNVPEFFTKATSRISNFKGMKADLGVAVQVDDLLGSDQRIFMANHLLAPAVLLGHESSIATVTNMFPTLVRDLVETTKRGDVARVRELQKQLNRLVDAVTTQGEFLPSMKTAMAIVTGVKVGPPRQPMAALNELNRTKVEQNLRNLGYGPKN